ncbi:hypothetical protein HK104_003028 [Borealophlyctis nickersoniae]|nr:hypothetical protein HK104_003028 [Borealophlyctis nickersoniae]
MSTDLLTIKAQLGNHYRRFSIPLANQQQSALPWGYSALVASIRNTFGISDGFGVRVDYLDDEGDWITVTSQGEFAEGLEFAVNQGSSSAEKVLRVRVEIVELPTYFTSSDPMTTSMMASLDIPGVDRSLPVTTSSQSPPSTPPVANAVEDPPPHLVQEYVTAIMDGAQPEFIPVGYGVNGSASGEAGRETILPRVPGDYASYSAPSNLAVYINEFHFHRLIIQTTITEALRTLFDSPDSDEPNGFDAALNELEYRRVIVQSAIESAFRVLFAGTAATNYGEDDQPNLPRRRSMESIREALEPFLSSTASTTEGLVRAVHEKSKYVSAQIVNAVRAIGQQDGSTREMRSEPSGDVLGQTLAEQGRAVFNLARSVVGGVASFLNDVGARMAMDDPFLGVEVENARRGRGASFPGMFPPRESSLMKHTEGNAAQETDSNSAGRGAPSHDDSAAEAATLQMQDVDASSVTPSVPDEQTSATDTTKEIFSLPSQPASLSPEHLPLSSPETDQSPSEMQKSYHSTVPDLSESRIWYPSSSSLSSSTLHVSDSAPIITVAVVDDAQSESDMSRVPDLDEVQSQQSVYGDDDHHKHSEGGVENDEDAFVMIDEDDLDLGAKSSTFVFPVL